jgi:hypothetical protein
MRMLRHLPPPGTGVIERHFILQSNGITYNGYIDWSGYFGGPTVIDHKTTADLRWAKTEADLHNDVQAVIYALTGFVGFDTDRLRLLWNYGETKGRFDVRPVETHVHLPLVQEKFKRVIEPTAAEIVEHRHAKTHPLSLPPTPKACSSFGGCPHRHRCNLTAQQTFGGLMTTGNGQGEMSMADRMALLSGDGQPPQQMQYQQPQMQPQMQPQPQQYPNQQQPQMQPQQYPNQQPQPGQYVQQPQYQQPPMQQPQPQYQQQVVPGQVQQLSPAPQPQPGQLPMFPQPMAMQPPAAAPQASQEPPRPYLPELAPNPPESGQQLPRTPGNDNDPAEAAEKTGRGRGRPKGVRNSKKSDSGLTVEQQVYVFGCMAAMVGGHAPAAGGEALVAAFKAKFGDDAC